MFLALILTAHAQVTPVPGRHETISVIDEDAFATLEIDGQLLGPPLKVISEIRRPGFSSFVHLRLNFDSELRQSVNELERRGSLKRRRIELTGC